jgi:hypothetical protein
MHADSAPRNPVLVVGTGRCGSTLVSTMMRAHPEVLSLSELFSFVTDLGCRIPQAFADQPVSGGEFWRVVGGCHPRGNLMLRHGLRIDEVTYPFERGRYPTTGDVPAVLMTALPHLDDDPDGLFDELTAVMSAREPAPMVTHYRDLFSHLMRRYGKRTWVERSGGSLRAVEPLIAAFPEARLVHIVRDGRDTAISMSRHHGFRLAVLGFQLGMALGVDPWESDDRSNVEALGDLAALLPENFTAEAFRRHAIHPAMFGHYWTGEILRGLAALRGLPADRVVTLRYEDMLADPSDSVDRLSGAFGFAEVDPQWRRAATAMVGEPRSSWRSLPPADLAALEEACAPGFAALAEVGLRW